MGAIWGTRGCGEHFIPSTGMVLGYPDGTTLGYPESAPRRADNDSISAVLGKTRHFWTEIISVRGAQWISGICSIRACVRTYSTQVRGLIRAWGPPAAPQIEKMLQKRQPPLLKNVTPWSTPPDPNFWAPEASGRAGGVSLGRGDHGGSIRAISEAQEPQKSGSGGVDQGVTFCGMAGACIWATVFVC